MKAYFLNREENGVAIESLGMVELYGTDKEQYRQLDLCYDQNVVEIKRTESEDSLFNTPRLAQGSFSSRPIGFVNYGRPINLTLDGKEVSLPLEIPPQKPIIVTARFPVDSVAKNTHPSNFFVLCPSIKLFDTRGQESISMCPGLIEMTFSKEEYSADSYRVAGLIAQRYHHLGTMGPYPEGGNVYRVFATTRAAQFQLTPKVEGNTCPESGTE